MLGYLFQTSLFQYAPFVVAGLLILLFIPGMMTPRAKPEGVGRAIACVLWKTFGLLLVALSLLQLTSDVVTTEALTPEPMLSVLILIFAVGVGMMVQASRVLANVDAASKAVPKLVFVLTCEIVGGLLIVITGMTIAINFILTQTLAGWQMQTVTILLGIVLMLGASMHVNPAKKKAAVKKKK